MKYLILIIVVDWIGDCCVKTHEAYENNQGSSCLSYAIQALLGFWAFYWLARL